MTEAITGEIVETIAEVEDTEPADLDMSLQNHVSTDAIRQLVDHESESWRLQFETPNHIVEVRGDETIVVDGERRRSLT